MPARTSIPTRAPAPERERWRKGTARRSLIAKLRLAEIAERQWGVITRAQLEAEGVTKGEVCRWVGEQRLHRLHPGVYAVGHPALALEGRLAGALLYAGPGAALWGLTAGSWLGLIKARPRTVHVCTPRRRRSPQGVRVHARRRFERTWHNRFPVMPPAETLLDIAGVVRFTQLRRALAEAEYLRLVTLDDVAAVLGRGRRGSAALRAALDCHRPQLARTRSLLEERFVLLCECRALDPPVMNAWVAGWLVDAVWFDEKVVVELDGQAAHGTPMRLERDRRRDLALRAAGYVVARYTWQQVTATPEPVVADLRRMLGM